MEVLTLPIDFLITFLDYHQLGCIHHAEQISVEDLYRHLAALDPK